LAADATLPSDVDECAIRLLGRIADGETSLESRPTREVLMPSDAPTLVSRLARAFIDHTSADRKDGSGSVSAYGEKVRRWSPSSTV
jgi:hypothetical protein